MTTRPLKGSSTSIGISPRTANIKIKASPGPPLANMVSLSSTGVSNLNVTDEWSQPEVGEVLASYRPRLYKIFIYFGHARCNDGMMDIREFLFMLRELDIIDRHNLTIKVAIKIVIATMANLGTIERRNDPDPNHHQGDLLSFANFVTALGRCYEVKTYDGIVPLDKRLSSCFVGDLFQKVRSRTDIAALWL